MSTARRLHYPIEDYLLAAEMSAVKLEYFDGEICRAGGTPEHAALAAETTIRLGAKLKAGCQAFTSDARIHVEPTGLSTYPDAHLAHIANVKALGDGELLVVGWSGRVRPRGSRN